MNLIPIVRFKTEHSAGFIPIVRFKNSSSDLVKLSEPAKRYVLKISRVFFNFSRNADLENFHSYTSTNFSREKISIFFFSRFLGVTSQNNFARLKGDVICR